LQLLAYEINHLPSHDQRRHCWPVHIPLRLAVKQQIFINVKNLSV